MSLQRTAVGLLHWHRRRLRLTPESHTATLAKLLCLRFLGSSFPSVAGAQSQKQQGGKAGRVLTAFKGALTQLFLLQTCLLLAAPFPTLPERAGPVWAGEVALGQTLKPTLESLSSCRAGPDSSSPASRHPNLRWA